MLNCNIFIFFLFLLRVRKLNSSTELKSLFSVVFTFPLTLFLLVMTTFRLFSTNYLYLSWLYDIPSFLPQTDSFTHSADFFNSKYNTYSFHVVGLPPSYRWVCSVFMITCNIEMRILQYEKRKTSFYNTSIWKLYS